MSDWSEVVCGRQNGDYDAMLWCWKPKGHETPCGMWSPCNPALRACMYCGNTHDVSAACSPWTPTDAEGAE